MAEGVERRRALAQAARIRLRPILMTTLTTVLALVPLAIGAGEAAQMRGPMALTIIGGLICHHARLAVRDALPLSRAGPHALRLAGA